MDANSSKERLERTEQLHQETEKSEKPTAVRDIKKKASEVLKSQETAEALEGQEGVESGGKISEISAEDKAYAPGGGIQGYSADQVEAIRAKLLAALPPQEVMIREIRNKLYKKEKVLSKRMKKLQKNSHKSAFQLTVVVSQIRKIREYFSMLAHATYEMVKHLWLKIVHGV